MIFYINNIEFEATDFFFFVVDQWAKGCTEMSNSYTYIYKFSIKVSRSIIKIGHFAKKNWVSF